MNQSYDTISPQALVSENIVFQLDSHSRNYPHCHVGALFFDAEGILVTSGLGGGPITITIETACSPGGSESPTYDTIVPATPTTVDWTPAASVVTATLTAPITGAVTWALNYVAYES